MHCFSALLSVDFGAEDGAGAADGAGGHSGRDGGDFE